MRDALYDIATSSIPNDTAGHATADDFLTAQGRMCDRMPVEDLRFVDSLRRRLPYLRVSVGADQRPRVITTMYFSNTGQLVFQGSDDVDK